MNFNLGIWCVILGQCNFFSKVKLSLNRFNGTYRSVSPSPCDSGITVFESDLKRPRDSLILVSRLYNYLNAFFKRSSPSFTVSSGQPMFMRKKPSPSGPKSVPLFKPSFASWSSFS